MWPETVTDSVDLGLENVGSAFYMNTTVMEDAPDLRTGRTRQVRPICLSWSIGRSGRVLRRGMCTSRVGTA